MSRATKLFLAFVCIGQILGCAKLMWGEPKPGILLSPAPPVDSVRVVQFDSIAHVNLDSAFTQFFTEERVRQFNHPTVADAEKVHCLYGIIHGDTADVVLERPAKMLFTSSSFAMYEGCPIPLPGLFGLIRFLGNLHNHNGGVDCAFSLVDDRSFFGDPGALIDIVTCSQGFVVRSKPVKRT